VDGRIIANTKNSYKSTRKQTDEEKAAQAAKAKATKKQKNKAARNAAVNNFFIPQKNKAASQAADTGRRQAEEEGSTTTPTNTNNENEEDEPIVITNPVVTNVDSEDIVAALDFDEKMASASRKSDEGADEELPGIQQRYVKAIQKRVQEEISKDNKSINTWLLEHLKSNDWWIRKDKAHWIAKKLGLKKQYNAYYRDVLVWLPHIRWEDKVNRAFVPPCPHCKTNARVGPHCWRDNHHARLIVGLKETYYTISMRYICSNGLRPLRALRAPCAPKSPPSYNSPTSTVKISSSAIGFWWWIYVENLLHRNSWN